MVCRAREGDARRRGQRRSEMSSDDARKLVHPKNLTPLELRLDQAFLEQEREFIGQFRIRRARQGRGRVDRGAQPHIL